MNRRSLHNLCQILKGFILKKFRYRALVLYKFLTGTDKVLVNTFSWERSWENFGFFKTICLVYPLVDRIFQRLVKDTYISRSKVATNIGKWDKLENLKNYRLKWMNYFEWRIFPFEYPSQGSHSTWKTWKNERSPWKPGKSWNFEKFNKYHGKMIWNLEKLGGY